MTSSGMLSRVALIITDISEEPIASIISMKRIGELGTTLAVTSNRSTLVTGNVVTGSPILVTLMMEVIVPPKRRFLQEPDGVTSQKTAFLKTRCVY
jgi:hypothetical protein